MMTNSEIDKILSEIVHPDALGFYQSNAVYNTFRKFADVVVSLRQKETKQMTDRELMQMALTHLEHSIGVSDESQKRLSELKKALRDRLAQPEQEPVAWVKVWSDSSKSFYGSEVPVFGNEKLMPLYTAPPNIEAVVLAEREACAKVCDEYAQSKRFDGYYIEGFADGADVCANAIRARGA
jgi:hypothetical protein